MVKGISRQVILVRSPDPRLFEQAIFILKEDAPQITDEELLKEARRLMKNPVRQPQQGMRFPAALWAALGAAATGIVWLLSACLA